MQKYVRFNDGDDCDDSNEQAFSVAAKKNTTSRYVVRIHTPIQGPDKYGTLLNLLETSGHGDTIELDISSPGGVLDTAVLIRRAIMESEASVICRIGPTCASAAGAIALACDGWYVDEMSTLMVHTGSLGLGFGKVNDLHAASTHNLKLIERFIRLTYTGFVTDAELEYVLEGKEYYFDAEELSARLEQYAELRREAAAADSGEEEEE